MATPSPLHLEHALECVEASIPLLVEKPIATTIADGLRIVHAAAEHGVPLLVGDDPGVTVRSFVSPGA